MDNAELHKKPQMGRQEKEETLLHCPRCTACFPTTGSGNRPDANSSQPTSESCKALNSVIGVDARRL